MPHKDPEVYRAYHEAWRRSKGIPPKKPKMSDEERAARKKKYKKKNSFVFLLRYRYGMTVEQYEAKLAEQGGVCAICKGTSKRRLSVDHNHTTGEVRSLLCVRCNAGIGNFLERADLLYSAVQYLEKWGQK
jgi:hypothetical protein